MKPSQQYISDNPAVLPALDAVARLRAELQKRSLLEGGLAEVRQGRSLSWLQTIEATLLQVVPLGSMITTINQQAQIAAAAVRGLNRVQLTEGNSDDNGKSGVEPSDEKGA